MEHGVHIPQAAAGMLARLIRLAAMVTAASLVPVMVLVALVGTMRAMVQQAAYLAAEAVVPLATM